MMTRWLSVLAVVGGCQTDPRYGVVSQGLDQDPTGSLDGAGSGVIGGWAFDPDTPGGPITVAIYVDGSPVQVALANQYRSDLAGVCPELGGDCAFTWNYSFGEGFGDGSHSVVAYAIGVSSGGQPDGDNVALNDGVPITFSDGCKYLNLSSLPGYNSSAYDWCEGNGGYWTDRQKYTTLVGNPGVYVGVDNAAGGTIFQLRGAALDQANTGNVFWGNNLEAEHGGGAIQVSLYGIDDKDDVNEFPMCNGPASTQNPKVWNPIQAQGSACGWGNLNTGVANQVTTGCYVANTTSTTCASTGTTYYTKETNPFDDTMQAQAIGGLTYEQWVTPLAGYAEIRYRVIANNLNDDNEHRTNVTWSDWPQEVPAFYTAEGMSAAFYSYTGSQPFKSQPVTTFHRPTKTQSGYLSLPLPPKSGLTYPNGPSNQGCASENWWGACDPDATRCVTIATFDLLATEGSIAEAPMEMLQYPTGTVEAYLSPIGWFNLAEGSDVSWTIYVFPYRYDQVPYGSTLTTRQIIYELAQAAGVSGRVCPTQ